MAVIFSDNFTGTVNSPLSTRISSGGSAWQCFGIAANDVTGLKINAGNQVKVSTATGCLARADMGIDSHYAKATVFTLTTAAAVVCRATDNLNFIGFRISNATTVELFKRITGTETSLFKVTVATLAVPVTLQLTFAGTTATLFVNGAQVGLAAGYQVPDAGFIGVTKVGLWGRLSALDPLADNFEGGTAFTGLAPLSGRSGSTDRNVGVTANAGAAVVIAAIGARSGTTDRGVSAVAAYAVRPDNAGSGQIGRAAGVAEMFALAPARARSASFDRGVAIVATPPLTPTNARSGLTDRGMTLLRTGALVPATARLEQLARPVAIAVLGLIAPAGARLAQRAGVPTALMFKARLVTPVPTEVRTVPVLHD